MTEAKRNLGNLLGDRGDSTKTAIVSVDREGRTKDWSYRTIEQRSLAVGALLRQRGLGTGARVGILAENSAEYLFAYLGIMRSGCVCVPINGRQPADVIEFICRDAGVDLVFGDEVNASRAPEWIDRFPIESVTQLPTERAEFAVNLEATAQILYTSGSTGRPKGVVLSHRSQLAMIDAITSAAERSIFEQRGIVVAPMFHMNALVFITSYLTSGGSFVLVSKFEANRFAELIRVHGVTAVTGVPTMIAMLHAVWEETGSRSLPKVGVVYIGSAPVTESISRQAVEMMPNAKVLNSYGTTETGGGLFGPHPNGLERPPTSVGFPRTHVRVRLADEEDGQGVLLVNAPSAMTEYLNLPEVTAERLKDGWFDTGDLFRKDEDGFYYFVGRVDDMFVCSGENIYPGEIEKAIESHGAIDQAVVVPVVDQIRGQMPVAFAVRNDLGISELDIQEYVKRSATPYLYPRRVWFVQELPLTGATKINRRVLKTDAERRMQRERENSLRAESERGRPAERQTPTHVDRKIDTESD